MLFLVGVLLVELCLLGMPSFLVCLALCLAELLAELLELSLIPCALELGVVEVNFLLASQLDPERGRVDDDYARLPPLLGESLGVPDEEAEILVVVVVVVAVAVAAVAVVGAVVRVSPRGCPSPRRAGTCRRWPR